MAEPEGGRGELVEDGGVEVVVVVVGEALAARQDSVLGHVVGAWAAMGEERRLVKSHGHIQRFEHIKNSSSDEQITE